MNTTGSGKAMLQISTNVNVEYQWLLKSAQQHIAWFYALEAENISFKGNIFEMTVCARYKLHIFMTLCNVRAVKFRVLTLQRCQPMETVLRKTRESTGVNCRNVRRRVRCQ